MAGVHRLEHVESLSGAHLAHDDPVGPHAERVLHQLALRNLAPSFDVRRARLKPDHMLLLKLELRRILDRDDSLAPVDEGRNRVEHRRLARERCAAP